MTIEPIKTSWEFQKKFIEAGPALHLTDILKTNVQLQTVSWPVRRYHYSVRVVLNNNLTTHRASAEPDNALFVHSVVSFKW